jgi:hypothetical protein
MKWRIKWKPSVQLSCAIKSWHVLDERPVWKSVVSSEERRRWWTSQPYTYADTIRVFIAAVHVISRKMACVSYRVWSVCEVLYETGTLPKVSTSNLFSPFTTLAVMRETEVLEKGRIVTHVFLRMHNLGFINSSHFIAFRLCTVEEMHFAVPWSRLTAMLLIKLHTSASCIKWILLYNLQIICKLFVVLKEKFAWRRRINTETCGELIMWKHVVII